MSFTISVSVLGFMLKPQALVTVAALTSPARAASTAIRRATMPVSPLLATLQGRGESSNKEALSAL